MDIGKNLSQSFDVYKENIGTLLVAALVAVILSSVCFLIGGPIMLGFLLICRKTMRGEKTEIGELFAHFDKFVPTLLLMLMIGIPVGILCVIPFINFLMILLMPAVMMVGYFAMLSIAEENLAPVDALKKGISMLQTNLVGNWVYGLVFMIISSICSFITMPIGAIGMISAYDELNNSAAAPINVTPSV